MRKIVYLVMMASMMMPVGCSTANGNDNGVSDSTDSGFDIEIGTISDRDMWLRIPSTDLKTEQSKRLADVYNAVVVMNSLITDFDLQMRFDSEYDNTVEAIKQMDISKVKDQETWSILNEYKKEMLYLLSANPDSVNQEIHNPWKAKNDLYAYLSKKYNVRTFGTLNEDHYWDEYNNCPSVPEWAELRGKRGDEKMVEVLKKKYNQAKDFDARCIYAIELGHAYEADMNSWGEDDQNPAVPIMESLMKESKYSLYLNELWQKWRVLYQNGKGYSKDSEIPNFIYNDFRNRCACTILSYIEGHPNDINAINEFLVLACKANILREGEFSYGNQIVLERYYLFPEIYEKIEANNNKKEVD
jgi:hypothetical protein